MILPAFRQHRLYYTIKQMQMMRFNGVNWELFGPLMTREVSN